MTLKKIERDRCAAVVRAAIEELETRVSAAEGESQRAFAELKPADFLRGQAMGCKCAANHLRVVLAEIEEPEIVNLSPGAQE